MYTVGPDLIPDIPYGCPGLAGVMPECHWVWVPKKKTKQKKQKIVIFDRFALIFSLIKLRNRNKSKARASEISWR